MTAGGRRPFALAPLLATIVASGSCVPAQGRPVEVPPQPPVRQVPPPPAPVAPGAFLLGGAARQGGVVLGTAPPGTIALTLDGGAVGMAHDRRFLIAFDRDAGPNAVLLATRGDGEQVTRDIPVAPGAWRIEPIDAPLTAGRTNEEFARLRPAEVAQIAAARATECASDGWRQHFRWPVSGRRSGQFGAQRVYRGVPGSYHSGTDVAVAAGTPVVAPADGVVALAADHPFTLEGNLVILDHGMGLTSAFLHFSRIDVHVGEIVRQGQPIGLVGATGRATGPHMHWGMTWHGRRIDPAPLAGPMK